MRVPAHDPAAQIPGLWAELRLDRGRLVTRTGGGSVVFVGLAGGAQVGDLKEIIQFGLASTGCERDRELPARR